MHEIMDRMCECALHTVNALQIKRTLPSFHIFRLIFKVLCHLVLPSSLTFSPSMPSEHTAPVKWGPSLFSNPISQLLPHIFVQNNLCFWNVLLPFIPTQCSLYGNASSMKPSLICQMLSSWTHTAHRAQTAKLFCAITCIVLEWAGLTLLLLPNFYKSIRFPFSSWMCCSHFRTWEMNQWIKKDWKLAICSWKRS